MGFQQVMRLVVVALYVTSLRAAPPNFVWFQCRFSAKKPIPAYRRQRGGLVFSTGKIPSISGEISGANSSGFQQRSKNSSQIGAAGPRIDPGRLARAWA